MRHHLFWRAFATPMSHRLTPTAAPGPLEDFAAAFDDLFDRKSQRESFRRYLEGLLLPTERNKTLTALANTEPVTGSTHLAFISLRRVKPTITP